MKKFLIENWWWSVVFIASVIALLFSKYWLACLCGTTDLMMLSFMMSGKAKREKKKNSKWATISFIGLSATAIMTGVALVMEVGMVVKLLSLVPLMGTLLIANMGGKKK